VEAAASLKRVDEGWLPRVWAAFLLLLVATSWPLWFGAREFPLVPFFPISQSVIRIGSGLSTGLLVFSLVLIVVRPIAFQSCWYVASLAVLMSFLVDQHRLQPWAYQAAIIGTVFAQTSRSLELRWCRWFLASMYLYSAIGKLDYQFAHTVGQDLLGPVYWLTQADQWLDRSHRILLALTLPALEGFIGVALLVPSTRRYAGYSLMGMHGSLFLLLGPLGFNHSTGVLLWNAMLMFAAWRLFVVSEPASEPETGSAPLPQSQDLSNSTNIWRAIVMRLIVGAAIVMPIGERWGYFDHWPSWALYSPHNSRVIVQVHSSAWERLPLSLRRSQAESSGNADDATWLTIDLDQWSLRERYVPIYPQARYQLGLVIALAKSAHLEDETRCILQSVSDRWSGRRMEQTAIGIDEMLSQR
jgi:hypothetical protein